MASDNEASCESDPNFAVICAFMEKFGVTCGLTAIDFLELQEMLENTQEVSQELIDLHIKLLRKSRKTVSNERWEKAIIKFCHTFCVQDAWEIERFGYKKARLSSKLRVLKELLEMQFDYNAKFKTEINKMSAEELRSQPLGKDNKGHAYWFQSDNNCQIRVYKEDPDEETWTLVVKDREGLVSLISDLNNGDLKLPLEAVINEEDSNSLAEKPIIDTGQVDSSSDSTTKKNSEESENSNESKPENISEDDVNTKRALESDGETIDAKKSKTEVSSPQVSEPVEEPLMLVKGEGDGQTNECPNPIVGEIIEEDLMVFYGCGNGYDCDTGNDEKDSKKDEASSSTNHVSITTTDEVPPPLIPTVKNPIKLGTILDTKTDNKCLSGAGDSKNSTKKSRWDVETMISKDDTDGGHVKDSPKKFFFGPSCLQINPATVGFGQKVPQTDNDSKEVEQSNAKGDIGYRIDLQDQNIETKHIGTPLEIREVNKAAKVEEETKVLQNKIEEKIESTKNDNVSLIESPRNIVEDAVVILKESVPQTVEVERLKSQEKDNFKCKNTVDILSNQSSSNSTISNSPKNKDKVTDTIPKEPGEDVGNPKNVIEIVTKNKAEENSRVIQSEKDEGKTPEMSKNAAEEKEDKAINNLKSGEATKSYKDDSELDKVTDVFKNKKETMKMNRGNLEVADTKDNFTNSISLSKDKGKSKFINASKNKDTCEVVGIFENVAKVVKNVKPSSNANKEVKETVKIISSTKEMLPVESNVKKKDDKMIVEESKGDSFIDDSEDPANSNKEECDKYVEIPCPNQKNKNILDDKVNVDDKTTKDIIALKSKSATISISKDKPETPEANNKIIETCTKNIEKEIIDSNNKIDEGGKILEVTTALVEYESSIPKEKQKKVSHSLTPEVEKEILPVVEEECVKKNAYLLGHESQDETKANSIEKTNKSDTKNFANNHQIELYSDANKEKPKVGRPRKNNSTDNLIADDKPRTRRNTRSNKITEDAKPIEEKEKLIDKKAKMAEEKTKSFEEDTKPIENKSELIDKKTSSVEEKNKSDEDEVKSVQEPERKRGRPRKEAKKMKLSQLKLKEDETVGSPKSIDSSHSLSKEDEDGSDGGKRRKLPSRSHSEDTSSLNSPNVSEAVVVESSTDGVVELSDKDPLPDSEEAVKKSETKTVSLTSFSLDFNEERTPSITRTGLRKRGREETPQNNEEKEGTGRKKMKIKGRRTIDAKLRKCIEERKKKELASSDDDNKSEKKNKKKPQSPTKKEEASATCSDEDKQDVFAVSSDKDNKEIVALSSGGQKKTTAVSSDEGQKEEVKVENEGEKSTNVLSSSDEKKAKKSKYTNPKNKNKRLLSNLGIDPEKILDNLDGKMGVRQSRRIAQQKIKEEAIRRKIEEEMAIEIYPTQKKKKSKKSEDKDYKEENENDDDSRESKKKMKRKKKKQRKPFDELNPWRSSSSDSSTSADEEEVEEEEEDEELQYVSDHEFSPESDMECDGPPQPLKRARTARKESDVEEVDDCPCQKCDKSDHPEWILLCDRCDNGWHCSCLRPPLLVIPEGDWFCPPCQHARLLLKLEEKLSEYDKRISKKELEDRRKQRLAYVGISLNNVLPTKDTEYSKKKKKSKLEVEDYLEDENDDANDKGDADDDAEIDDDEDSESEESGSSTSSSEESEDEPIYQLRQRRQAHSYRFNDYDDLINSAIQDEMEAVKGAGNQGRGKDIATIVNAEKEEEVEGERKVEETQEIEAKPPVVPLNDKDKEAKPIFQAEEEDNEEEKKGVIKIKKKLIGRKKHRKLNALDISSEDDDEGSDEDFKGTSEESDDDFEEDLGSEDSDVLEAGRRRRKGGDPVRRSTRARTSRYDADFIDDGESDDSNAIARRKKKRSMWDESSSSESDRSWGRRRRKPARSQRKNTSNLPKQKKSKKKKKNEDSDAEVYRKKKPKIKFGLDVDDDGPVRRTRGKKINYIDALGSDSDEDRVKRPPPRIESEEEYVADEEEKGTDDESGEEKGAKIQIQSYTNESFSQVLPEPAKNTLLDDADEENPILQINRNVEMMDENEMEKMMEEEEYANKQLQLVALQIEKEKRRKEREAKKMELEQMAADMAKKKIQGQGQSEQFHFGRAMPEPIVGNVDSLIVNSENNDELSEPPGVSLPLFAELGGAGEGMEDPIKKRRARPRKTLEEAVATLGSGRLPPQAQPDPFHSVPPKNTPPPSDTNIEIAAPPQPFSASQPTPSVITRMLQSKPGQPGYPIGAIRPKQFAAMPDDVPATPPPPYRPQIYRQINHYRPQHLYSGGGTIALDSPAESPGEKGTPPPPPYQRPPPPPVGGRFGRIVPPLPVPYQVGGYYGQFQEEAMPPTMYQTPYEGYEGQATAGGEREGNSKGFEEEGGGEFGGLVSYFSSQREDDLES